MDEWGWPILGSFKMNALVKTDVTELKSKLRGGALKEENNILRLLEVYDSSDFRK